MADLIERDSLRERTNAVCQSCGTNSNTGICEFCLFDDVQQEIDAAPSVNRWISVEDALPEKDKSYITYAETTKYCNHNELPEESRINILYFNGEEWYDEECRYYNVTHYMPLPEPPEKE